MWAIIVTFILFIYNILAYYSESKKNPERIFGVYSRPGKWYYIKYVLFYMLLEIQRHKVAFLEGWKSEGENNDTNRELPVAVQKLEALQPLSSHKKGFDAVFFQAVNMDGYYVCGGTERRHEALTFGLFYIGVPGIGLLASEKLPSTTLKTDPVSLHLQDSYSAEGICFAPLKPMEAWKVSFSGKMRLESKPNETFDVRLEATWSSGYPYFLYERHMNNKPIAHAIAREEWSREFFETMKETHQTHYEQMGNLKGTLIIDNEKHSLNMWAFRDHSFGFKRDWSLIHRYAFHMAYLNDGTRITIGVISHPSTMSHFEVGYVVHKNKMIDTIESCDLQLYQHGENGTPGKTMAFTFIAAKKYYVVKAVVEYEAVHYKGHDDEAKLIERFLKYDINGVQGRGIAEWHYNVGKKQ